MCLRINEIQSLFNLTEQNIGQDVFVYLGIELIFDRTKITIRQDRLIKKLFETTEWTNLKKVKTPAWH